MDLKRALEGLTLVAFGALLLAITLGYLPWSVLWNLLSLWPLLLVAAGIDVIGRALDNVWLRALSSLVVIGGLAFAALVMPTDGPRGIPLVTGFGNAEAEPFEFSEDADASVETGHARIGGGVGELNVRGTQDDLVAAEGRSPFGEPRFDVRTDGSEAEVRVDLGEGRSVDFGGRAEMDVALSEDVEWDIDLDAGVSSIDADLSGLRLSRLDVDMGVSQGTFRLGDTPDGDEAVRVSVDAGVSSCRIEVPKGAAVRLTSTGGLFGVRVPSGWREAPKDGDDRVWESEDIGGGDAFWDVRVDSGVSSVVVRTY